MLLEYFNIHTIKRRRKLVSLRLSKVAFIPNLHQLFSKTANWNKSRNADALHAGKLQLRREVTKTASVPGTLDKFLDVQNFKRFQFLNFSF